MPPPPPPRNIVNCVYPRFRFSLPERTFADLHYFAYHSTLLTIFHSDPQTRCTIKIFARSMRRTFFRKLFHFGLSIGAIFLWIISRCEKNYENLFRSTEVITSYRGYFFVREKAITCCWFMVTAFCDTWNWFARKCCKILMVRWVEEYFILLFQFVISR